MPSPASGPSLKAGSDKKFYGAEPKSHCVYMPFPITVLAILPEGSVKDETTFLGLMAVLAVFVGAAIYLRIRNRKQEQESPE